MTNTTNTTDTTYGATFDALRSLPVFRALSNEAVLAIAASTDEANRNVETFLAEAADEINSYGKSTRYWDASADAWADNPVEISAMTINGLLKDNDLSGSVRVSSVGTEVLVHNVTTGRSVELTNVSTPDYTRRAINLAEGDAFYNESSTLIAALRWLLA